MNSLSKNAGLLHIGKIVGVHGINGNIKIRSYAQSLSVFQPDDRLFLKIPNGREKRFIIKWVKPHAKTALLSLKGIANRVLAEGLVGSEVFVEKATLSEPEEGTYYWFDIIGLSVFTIDGEFVGQVDSILQTGSNDVYVVKNPKKGRNYEKLIPALESVVQSIDLESKIMTVDIPEGL